MDSIRVVVTLIYGVLAALAAAAAGMATNAVQPCVEYMIASVQVFYTHPGGLPERRHVFGPPTGSDPAKPNYFYGPARSDLRYVRQVAWSRWRGAREFWEEAVEGLLDPIYAASALTTPLGLGLGTGLILALPFGVLLAALVGLVHELAVDVATVGVRSAAITSKAVDSVFLSARHIQLRCVACFERIPYPAYRCPNPDCEKIHWDIRPGRFGVLRRTCECGTRMPTALLFGSARKMKAICPHRACQHPLEHRPGEAPEIILPIFGSRGAGKTLLLCAIIRTLLRESKRPGVHVAPADSATATRVEELESALAGDSAVDATPAVRPRAYVLRLRIGREHRILQLFDTAGELFYNSERSADLIFLGAANTFVLVIDPLSVNAFWNSLPSAERQQFAPHRSTAPHPELAFQQTVERIAEMGKPHAQHRLAIVFTRADLLGTEYGPSTDESADIQKWAIADLGLRGLLLQAELEFREVSFFYTAAFGSNGDSLDRLVHWIMRAGGITRASNLLANPDLRLATVHSLPFVPYDREVRQRPRSPVLSRSHFTGGG
jgi:hypothetical protein